MDLVIVDYGVGNLFSLKSSLAFLGYEALVTGDPEKIRQADKIILPGVGAFGDAMDLLCASGLAQVLKQEAAAGKDLMGICLGMQLLFEESEEFGVHQGLGLLKGKVVDMRSRLPRELKVPHMGWNSLHFVQSHPLFEGVAEGSFVYFVHSYFATACEESLLAQTMYGIPLTAAVCSGHVVGCQFHPEKSGASGLRILKNFCEWNSQGEKA